MVLAAGSIFAGYTILKLLGTGGMGEVYLAQHPRLPRREALKVLRDALTADAEFRQRFQREAETASTLYHPNIVEVHDRGEFEGQLWIAMDYINGTNAAELMRNQYPAGMPAGEVLAIVTAIAGALDYAHQRGLLHRDVKPANILLTNPEGGEQRILLTDFGIARHLGDTRGLTAPNLSLGAVNYAAPEQLTGADIDRRADQYALAATAFHLLTGAPPFHYSSPTTVVDQRLSTAAPRLSDRRPDLARLDDAMVKALASDPVRRFRRCRDFADAFNEAAGASMGDRSPEAVLAVAATEPAIRAEQPGSPSAHPLRRGGMLTSAGTGFLRRLTRRGRPSRSSGTQAATVEAHSPTSRWPGRRWPWILVGAATGAVLAAVGGVLVFGVLVKPNNEAAAPPGATPTTSPISTVAAAPPNAGPAVPPPGQQLNGAYRVDMERSRQTFNAAPDPQPPDVSTWWAFRSSCTSSGCVATGIELDNQNHQTARANVDGHLAFHFVDGQWQSVPETVPFPCIGPNGRSDKQTTTQVLSLQPDPHGPLRGVMTVTIESNECGQMGAKIEIPAVVERVDEVPPGVNIPGPSSAPPAPGVQVPAPSSSTGATPAPPTKPGG